METDREIKELRERIRLADLKIKRLELEIKLTDNIILMQEQIKFLTACIIQNDEMGRDSMFIRLLGLYIILNTYKDNKEFLKDILKLN